MITNRKNKGTILFSNGIVKKSSALVIALRNNKSCGIKFCINYFKILPVKYLLMSFILKLNTPGVGKSKMFFNESITSKFSVKFIPNPPSLCNAIQTPLLCSSLFISEQFRITDDPGRAT